MLIDKLPQGITMQLYLLPNGADRLFEKVLFSSSKKWLHPLFELEEFLAKHVDDSLWPSFSDLLLRDRVVGRAAAFLILRMGIRKVETDLASCGALFLLKEKSVAIETVETIDAIGCMTEDLLKECFDIDEVYTILAERRTKALAKYGNFFY